MKTTISTDMKLSSKIRKRIKHEIHKSLGANVCALHKIKIGTHESHTSNIFTKIEGEDPTVIFNDIITLGTNYLFCMIVNRRTKQKIFFLIDIGNPLYISEKNQIIMFNAEKEIVINVK
jgi:hypothetical protein